MELIGSKMTNTLNLIQAKNSSSNSNLNASETDATEVPPRGQATIQEFIMYDIITKTLRKTTAKATLTLLILGIINSIMAQPYEVKQVSKFMAMDSRQGDSLALVVLYKTLNGKNWNNQTFWLSSSSIDDWEGVFVHNQRVKHIVLSNNNLKGALPTEIANLTYLKRLSLNDNQITTIPATLGQLSNLRSLSLDNNEISQIPRALEKLTKLNSLSLKGNQLQQFPPAITKLRHLENLNLQQNQISKIPSEISKLQNLKWLYLAGNQIRVIPPAIGALENLVHLYLGDNQITHIPNEISKLTELSYLYLYNNQIQIIPNALGELINLTTLYLQDNHIKFIPPAIGGLSSLRTLYLNHNQIENFPPEIAKIKSLKRLHLEHNQITKIPVAMAELSSLRNFTIAQNRVEFSSLEALQGKLKFDYSPQDTLGSRQSIPLAPEVKIGVRVAGSHNHYIWYRDHEMIAVGKQADSITISHSGSYHVTITNEVISDLILHHNPIIVKTPQSHSSSVLVSSSSAIKLSSSSQAEPEDFIPLASIYQPQVLSYAPF